MFLSGVLLFRSAPFLGGALQTVVGSCAASTDPAAVNLEATGCDGPRGSDLWSRAKTFSDLSDGAPANAVFDVLSIMIQTQVDGM